MNTTTTTVTGIGNLAATTGGAAQVGVVAAPPPQRCAGRWDGPVAHTEPGPPLVWLLGAHGGAGVSTLAHVLAPAADCGRRWPCAAVEESPFVVLVCRESIDGLTATHELLREYHSGQVAPDVCLLGLVTCAHKPGRIPAEIARYLRIVEPLLPNGGRWRIAWQDAWPRTALANLPTWTPGEPAPVKGTDPLTGVRPFATDLLAAITAVAHQRHALPERTRP